MRCYCTSEKILPIGLPEMHHMIAPYQSIVYLLTLIGEMAAAVSQNNKTVVFNEPGCSLFIIFQNYSDDVSNSIYIFNYLNKLFADYRPPFVHTIHCIATHIIKALELNFLLASVSFAFNKKSKESSF